MTTRLAFSFLSILLLQSGHRLAAATDSKEPNENEQYHRRLEDRNDDAADRDAYGK